MSSFKDMLEIEFPEFAQEGLRVHNAFRRKHGVPELILSKELCSVAQEWADSSAKKGSITTKDNFEYGENVYVCTENSLGVVNEATNSWYKQIENYKWGTENVKKKSFPFTQLVWKSTSELGLGMATSSKGKVFIIAIYSPKGNCSGQFVENVPEAIE